MRVNWVGAEEARCRQRDPRDCGGTARSGGAGGGSRGAGRKLDAEAGQPWKGPQAWGRLPSFLPTGTESGHGANLV